MDDNEYLMSSNQIVRNKVDPKENLLPLAIAIVNKLEKLTNLNKKISLEIMKNIKDLKDPSKISDHISSQLNISIN